MKGLRNLLFFYWAILLLDLSFSANAEQATVNIYIDNKIASLSGEVGDGSIENPYRDLSEALKGVIAKEMENVEEINLLLAPSTKSYSCGEEAQYNFDGNLLVSMSLGMWKNQMSCQNESYCLERPKIEFGGSILMITRMRMIQISELHLLNQFGMMLIDRSSLSLENITFTPREYASDPLIGVAFGESLSIVNIDVNMEAFSPILIFKSEIQTNILMQNIQIFFCGFEEGGKDWNSRNNLFQIISKGAKSTIKIENFSIKSKSPGLGLSLRQTLMVTGFGTVFLKGLNLEDLIMNMTRDLSLISLPQNSEVQISELSIKRNRFITENKGVIFSLEGLNNFEIVDSDFVENTVEGDDLLVIFNPVSTSKSLIANFQVWDNIFKADANIFRFSEEIVRSIPKTELKVNSITLNNNTNLVAMNEFSFVLVQGSQVSQLTISDVNYTMNSLSGRIFAMEFPLTGAGLKQLQTGITKLFVRNIQIKSNPNMVDTSFFYFIPSQEEISGWICNYIIEPFRLEISNLTLVNNDLSKGSNLLWFSEVGLFQIQYSQVEIENALIANNTFNSYSVLTIDQRPSSFLIETSEISNNSFRSSYLVNSNYISSGISCDYESNLNAAAKILYRYSFFVNSNVTNTSLDSSVLIKANHGFFALHGVRFSNMSLLKSKLASMAFSLFRLPPSSPGYREDKTIFSVLSYEGISEIFSHVFERRNQKDSVYFYSVYNNTFEQMNLDASKLISLCGYGFRKSWIGFERNRFLDISFTAVSPLGLICFESVDTLKFGKNRFDKMKGEAQILSVSQSQCTSMFIFEGNEMMNLKISSLISFVGETLETVAFNKNSIYSSDFSQIVIGLSSKMSSGDWLFNKMDLYSVRMIVNSSSSQTERYAIFSLFAANTTSAKSQVKFSNCTFESVSISPASKRDLATETNLIYVGSLQTFHIETTEIVKTQMCTSGTLVYILNSPTVMIGDCAFDTVSIKSQTGVISTFAFQVSIKNSQFRSVNNSLGHGILYLTPSKQNYTVAIESSVFSGISAVKGGIVSSQLYVPQQRSSHGENQKYTMSLQVSNCKITNIENDNSFLIIGGNFTIQALEIRVSIPLLEHHTQQLSFRLERHPES